MCITTEVEAVRTSEMSIYVNETSRHYIPEEYNFYARRREKSNVACPGIRTRDLRLKTDKGLLWPPRPYSGFYRKLALLKDTYAGSCTRVLQPWVVVRKVKLWASGIAGKQTLQSVRTIYQLTPCINLRKRIRQQWITYKWAEFIKPCCTHFEKKSSFPFPFVPLQRRGHLPPTPPHFSISCHLHHLC
jgi:hypothetical protein